MSRIKSPTKAQLIAFANEIKPLIEAEKEKISLQNQANVIQRLLIYICNLAGCKLYRGSYGHMVFDGRDDMPFIPEEIQPLFAEIAAFTSDFAFSMPFIPEEIQPLLTEYDPARVLVASWDSSEGYKMLLEQAVENLILEADPDYSIDGHEQALPYINQFDDFIERKVALYHIFPDIEDQVERVNTFVGYDDVDYYEFLENFADTLIGDFGFDDTPLLANAYGVGWMKLYGKKDFHIQFDNTNPKGRVIFSREFLAEILPDTDCRFNVYKCKDDNGIFMGIVNYHHDAPTGERYEIRRAIDIVPSMFDTNLAALAFAYDNDYANLSIHTSVDDLDIDKMWGYIIDEQRGNIEHIKMWIKEKVTEYIIASDPAYVDIKFINSKLENLGK